MGQPEKARDLASQAMQLDPKDRYAYANLGSAYLALNRYDEARSICDQAVSQKLDSIGVHLVLTDLASIRGDQAAYDHEMELTRGTPNEPFMLFWQAGGQAVLGKLRASRQTWEKARAQMLAVGDKDFAATLFAIDAFHDALFGYPADAKRKAAQALDLSRDREVRMNAAIAFANTGDLAKSASLLADLTREFPDNQYLRLVMAPMAQAEQAVQKNQPADAVTALETTRPYEFGNGPHGVGYAPVYLRGVAYLKLKDGVKAAAEVQRILDHRGSVASDPEYPMARLSLARAYVLQGDTAKARTAYQDFFAAWKDADPDVPVLVAAKAEYEKLK